MELINRQDALDIAGKLLVGAEQSHKFDMALNAYQTELSRLKSIEIIRCEDCKWWSWNRGGVCSTFSDIRPFPNDYCSRAEKKVKNE